MDNIRIAVEPYGCTMNKGEGQRASEMLRDMGHSVLPLVDGEAPKDADAVLLLTCDVIAPTERRMWKRMERISSSGKLLYVGGCLASISKTIIEERFPGAVVLDTMGLAHLEDAVLGAFSPAGRYRVEEDAMSLTRLEHMVPVSTGCLGRCSYCITKAARGPLRSLSPDIIVSRMEQGIAAGKREVLLTSQDNAVYGQDLSGGAMDLGGLLRMISSTVKGRYMLRVGMMNPSHALELWGSIASGFKGLRVFKFFHLPFQSGSDEVLQSMEREYTAGQFQGLVSMVRRDFPSGALSTDVIVGFPGETRGQFEESVRMVEKVRPEVLNITRFSKREGTAAASMKGQVPGWRTKEWSRELTRLHRGMLLHILEGRLGHHERCLVVEVGKRKGTMMARNRDYIPIVIEGERDILGSFVDVQASSVGPTYLLGGREWTVSKGNDDLS